MEFTYTVSVAAVAGSVDLADCIFDMMDEEYRACAKRHHTVGIVGADKRLGIVNVEQIAGTLIIQHYSTRVAERDHTRLESGASEGFLNGSSELRCPISFDALGGVTAAGNGQSLHKHLVEETGGFARDFARKHVQQKQ